MHHNFYLTYGRCTQDTCSVTELVRGVAQHLRDERRTVFSRFDHEARFEEEQLSPLARDAYCLGNMAYSDTLCILLPHEQYCAQVARTLTLAREYCKPVILAKRTGLNDIYSTGTAEIIEWNCVQQLYDSMSALGKANQAGRHFGPRRTNGS